MTGNKRYDRQSGRHNAPCDRTFPECVQLPAGAVRGLQVSRGDVLQHLLLKRQIGNKTLQADILAFQVLHPLRLIDLKTAVFLAPAIKTLQRYARIPAGHRRRFALCHQHLNLTKQRHDLLRAKPLLRHDPSSFPSSFSHNAWSRKARSGHFTTMQMLLATLQLGGSGATMPPPGSAIARHVIDAFEAKDHERAAELQLQFALFPSKWMHHGLAPVMKAAMNLIGIPVGEPYPPYVPLSRDEMVALAAVLRTTVLADRLPVTAAA